MNTSSDKLVVSKTNMARSRQKLAWPLLLTLSLLLVLAPAALAASQTGNSQNASDNKQIAAVEGSEVKMAMAAGCTPNSANILSNGSFESGSAGWTFYSSGTAQFKVGSPASDCNNAAHITFTKIGNNMQLYQSGFALKANTKYRLSFAATSSSGNNLRVYLQQHSSPYGSLGLDGPQFNLTNSWQQFSTEFTTSGFSGTTTNTRLRFWFVRYAANGEVYDIDNVVLEEVGGGSTQPTATSTAVSGNTGCTALDSILSNADFESGNGSWNFYTNGSGAFSVAGPGYQCKQAAKITLTRVGSNMQFYQSGFPLRANGRYRLTFAAYSSSGNDMQVYIQRHGSPYAVFGLNGVTANLTNSWKTYSFDFTASGFSGTTTDTRLRFWFPNKAANGDIYYIDAVELQEIGGSTQPTSTATPAPGATATPKPTATATPPSGGGGGGKNELLVFDWNGPVTEAERGFPYNQPPIANGDWTSPVNFAQGTLQYRVEIRSQPKPQNMNIQFCFWQEKNGDRFKLENCGPQKAVYGASGTVATWSVGVNDMWKKDGKSIEWNRARYRNGAAIKTSSGLPVSNYNGWNWNGQNPAYWYPLVWRYTVVVVAKGATFSGWQNYK